MSELNTAQNTPNYAMAGMNAGSMSHMPVIPHATRVLNALQDEDGSQRDTPIRRSWARCVKTHRLHPDRHELPPVTSPTDLSRRRERMKDVLDCARSEMNTLFQQLGEPCTAVVLTDLDGVILHLTTAPDFKPMLEKAGFVIGSTWSEARAGTNGMGTCLVEAQPVSVQREEHFFSNLTELTCSAVPLHDPDNRMIGVLDVTSLSSKAQQHVLVLLGMTARMIENRLLDVRSQNAYLVNFHSRPEFLSTLHEGRLAVAEDGRILGANRSALFQLDSQSLDTLREGNISDVFQTSLPDLVERIRAAHFHPVVNYRAGGTHRFFFSVIRGPAAGGQRQAFPTPGRPKETTRDTTTGRTTPPKTGQTPAGQGEADIRGFSDPTLASHLEIAQRVIARGTPIMLRGPTGAGKEVFARTLHQLSPCAQRNFVAVNCASIPESLIESELFGYRAGAFTGAHRTGYRGKIVQAHGGTLFLDEIGDMALDLQTRLLRVLDERRISPLGSEESVPVEFQLLSATHRDLPSLVAQGRFREDLYYRLNGIELRLPALAERQDLGELISSILLEEQHDPNNVAPEATSLLMRHPWPGNVRQLRHVLRAAAALADGATITIGHLPSLASNLLRPEEEMPAAANLPAPAGEATGPCPEEDGLTVIERGERQAILMLLEQNRWNVSYVARSLNLSRNSLYRRFHKLRIPLAQKSR
ncbi:sigma-54-dependent Fis family transcriptional regulator [Xanthobacter sp. TB0139]|uniref:sigma-54-dependent Fis family transcriptional regulator n=1 Tax=Xanthobacter sp. TB0139 TaxID=3459178 RepID=UPI004039CFC9